MTFCCSAMSATSCSMAFVARPCFRVVELLDEENQRGGHGHGDSAGGEQALTFAPRRLVDDLALDAEARLRRDLGEVVFDQSLPVSSREARCATAARSAAAAWASAEWASSPAPWFSSAQRGRAGAWPAVRAVAAVRAMAVRRLAAPCAQPQHECRSRRPQSRVPGLAGVATPIAVHRAARAGAVESARAAWCRSPECRAHRAPRVRWCHRSRSSGPPVTCAMASHNSSRSIG